MSKFIVVSIHRNRWFWPTLKVVDEARVSSAAAGEKFITQRVMNAYKKRMDGKKGAYISIRVKEYRVVDATGLKRLQAAAKASVTLRRRRAAKKAAATRVKNRTRTVRPVNVSFGGSAFDRPFMN
jgi:hypothetical protein